MVRRWSYINEINFSLKNKKLYFFKKASKSRVFKLSVSTRKFFKKYTKFRRKAFNRLRHRSNWLIYSNIFKFWSYDYLKTKTFSKRCLLFYTYKHNAIVFNWSCLKNLNLDLFFNLNFVLLNLNSFYLKQPQNYFSNFFFWKFFKNASIFLSDTEVDYIPEKAASVYLIDNHFYELNFEIKNRDEDFPIDHSYALFLQYSIDFYKLFVNLTFYNL